MPDAWLPRLEGLAGHRYAPLAIGVVSAAIFWWVAGMTLRVEPLSTDEASYLLQAKIFAAGHLTAPGAPLPDFFEQPWVIVTPAIYSKYPPGHALALAPGVALGLPWLVPLLLDCAATALLFALLRRALGAGTALLVWVGWVFSGMALSWQTSYFSEVTLLPCWLGAVAATWRWIDGGGRRWLVIAAALAGYGAITRPLSILLLLLPLVPFVWRDLRRTGRWRDLGVAAGVTATFVLLLPLWNLGTTGDAGRSPLREYTETYIPWDRLGFAIDSTTPLRPPPPDLAPIAAHLLQVHREHTIARLPRTLGERAWRVAHILFTGWRLGLALFGLLGVWRLGRMGWLCLAPALTEFFGHAIWAHEAGWALYYAESVALWFLPGAVGLMVAVEWLLSRGGGIAAPRRGLAAVMIAVPLLLLLSVGSSAGYRAWRAARVEEGRSLESMVARGPDHAIYFVRYGPPRSGRPALVRNDPFLTTARAWVVYDLGPRNEELQRLAPERTGYLVDVESRTVTALPRAPGGVPRP